jgi:hypothetical protein
MLFRIMNESCPGFLFVLGYCRNSSSSFFYSVKLLLSEANMSFTHAAGARPSAFIMAIPFHTIASQISKGPFSHPKPAFIASSILYSSSDISEFG